MKKPGNFMEFLSSLARLLSWFPPFGLLEPEKSRLSAWTSWWNLSFLKKLWSESFSWRNIFPRKTYLFFKFFFTLLFFYKNRGFLGFFFGSDCWVELYIMLRKYAQILGAIQKVRTLWWRKGEGVLHKCAKTYKGRGSSKSIRKAIFF